jgi:hypothetical protein
MSVRSNLDRITATISSGSPNEARYTFNGSCHCGFIKYSVRLPQSTLDTRTGRRCNCTVCLKQGITSLGLPESDFKLISPSSLADCNDYRINADNEIHKYFCGTCGVHVVGAGQFPWQGQIRKFFQINLGTLDQPQKGLDLSQWKMVYVDGRNNGWEKQWLDQPHPGGLV